MQNHRSSAFTIVELLIVIVVIAILAAITIVAYTGIQNRAKSTAAISGAEQAGKKIAVYTVGNGNTLPTSQANFATATGLADSGGTTYQYAVNTAVSPNTFCVTYTNGGASAHIAGDAEGGVNKSTAGPCPGHSGVSPTTLADGSGCPSGYIVVPGSSLYNTDAFCVMKYEAKNVGGVPTSEAAAAPWGSISQADAVAESTTACTGCHLTTESEWLTIAQNVLYVGSNWNTGAVGSGWLYRGHTDNNPAAGIAAGTNDADGYTGTGQTTGEQRRTFTLSNGEVIWDLAGNSWEWTQGTIEGAVQPGPTGSSSWRQWNASNVMGTGAVQPNPSPIYANPAAVAWSSANNLGMINSTASATELRAILHGSYRGDGSVGGVFGVSFATTPTTTGSHIGFRVAR